MIFSCGITRAEHVRRRAEWHDFFPLWPRTVQIVNGEERCAWLQTIQRRSEPAYDGDWYNEYRLKPEGSA